MAITPADISITIRRGDTEKRTFRIMTGEEDVTGEIPFDLTGYTLKGQARVSPDAPLGGPLWELPITVIDAPDGRFQIYWTATQTASMDLPDQDEPTSGFYDIQISKDGEEDATTSTFMSGSFTIIKDYART